MRAMWTGALSFGLVNIPVRMYSAVGEGRPSFRMLHKKDTAPIKFVRVCSADGKEVPYEDIVKGYEYQKGHFIILTEDDFKNANVRMTKTIDITEFADESEIDMIYAEKPYFLEPDKGAAKPYALLLEALRQSKKVGIARFVIRNREHIGAIRPVGGVITLNQLRYEREIRKPTELDLPDTKAADKRELDMAIQLISQLSASFKPSAYKDTYADELGRVIDAKVKGQKPKAKGTAPQNTEVRDLMSALQKSLQREKQKTTARR